MTRRPLVSGARARMAEAALAAAGDIASPKKAIASSATTRRTIESSARAVRAAAAPDRARRTNSRPRVIRLVRLRPEHDLHEGPDANPFRKCRLHLRRRHAEIPVG